MRSAAVLVQEPDYVGLRKLNIPARPVGVVYDGMDPYATPLGIILMVVEDGRTREIYVRRDRYEEEGLVVYTHTVEGAQYIISRNGFEDGQLKLSEELPSENVKCLLREFFQRQNTPDINKKYVMRVCD